MVAHELAVAGTVAHPSPMDRRDQLADSEVRSSVGVPLYCRGMSNGRSERTKLAETLTNLWTVLISIVVVVVGVVVLALSAGWGWLDKHESTQSVAEALGGILITTGGLAILWDLRGKRDIIREVLAKVEVSSDVEVTGIQRASMDWRVVPWSELIGQAKSVDVFIAYGSTWLSTYSTDLAEFAKHRGNRMRYILPDPDDSTAMAVLAERFDYTAEIIKSKIEESAQAVAKLSRDGSADIRVYYRRGAPTFTCYRFDDTVVVTMYQHKVARGAIPTIVMGPRGTFRDFFASDLEEIVSQSREVGRNELLGEPA